MRSLALVATGLWLGLLAASWMIASISFRTSAALLGPQARRELSERLAPLIEADRRAVLRHAASEANRAMFGRWLVVQIALGAVVVGLALRTGAPWPAAAAMAIVLVQAALHGPILEIGRSVDFLPRPLPADIASRFGRLHAAYVLLDLAKAGVLVWLAWRLAKTAR